MKWQTLRKEKVIQIIQKQLDKVYRLCYTVYRVKEGGEKVNGLLLSRFKRIAGTVLQTIHITSFAVSSDKKTMKENNSQYVYNNKKSGKKNFSIDAIKSLHPE